MADEMLVFNGVDGRTGAYDFPPLSIEEFAKLIQQAKPPENLPELRFRYQQRAQKHLNVSVGMDPRRLDETGWGLILAQDADAAIQDALAPLLDLRRKQAGDYFQIYSAERAVQPGESKEDFLARHNVYAGIVDPRQMPFYLLIAGSPQTIPYTFQNELDVGYAVGRLHLDTLDDYAAYAQAVVEAETSSPTGDMPRRAALFAPVHDGDQWTQLGEQFLVEPLMKRLLSNRYGWDFDLLRGPDATKANLARLLGGDRKAALLFTAAHGLVLRGDDPAAAQMQGALVCQDWPGPVAGRVDADQVFTAADVAAEADLRGQIVFCYGSYGAGTPRDEDFPDRILHMPQTSSATVAPLAKRLLAGGALALIGQMDRTWSYAFPWSGAGAQTTIFESALLRLLSGDPVGFAAEHFDERYAEMASDLTDMREQVTFGASIDPHELVGVWAGANDMRSHVVFGDPAVRLRPTDQAS